MIVTADARKGAPDPSAKTAQPSATSAQSAQATFGLILSTLGPQGPDGGAGGTQPLSDKAEDSGDTKGSPPDSAAEDGLAAIIAAWLAEKAGRIPASQDFPGLSSAGASPSGLGVSISGAVQGLEDPSASVAGSGSQTDQGEGSTLRTLNSGGSVSANALAAALMAAVNSGKLSGAGSASGSEVGSASFQSGGSAPFQAGGAPSEASPAAAFLSAKPESTVVSIAAASAVGVDPALFVKDINGDTGAQAVPLDDSSTSAASRGFSANVDSLRSAAQAGIAGVLGRAHSVRDERQADDRSAEIVSRVSERAQARVDMLDGAGRFAGDAFTPRFSDLLGVESRVRAHLESSDALLASTGPAAQASSASQPETLTPPFPARETLANARALEGSVSWLASQHGGSATIDLVPPELGSLRIELKVDPAGTSATLVVHAASDAARVAVEQALDRLYEAFQGSGMSLSVSVGGGSSSFTGYMPGSQGGDPREAGNLFVRASAASPEVPGIGRPARTVGNDVLSLYA